MKRSSAVFFVICLMLSICGCAKTSLDTSADVTLSFVYADKNIRVTLDDEEAKKVIDILNGNRYDPLSSGTPSCGFDENISLQVGDRVFAIACDTCNCVQNLSNMRYFDISQEDMAYIHSLFEKHGGYFPCI